MNCSSVQFGSCDVKIVDDAVICDAVGRSVARQWTRHTGATALTADDLLSGRYTGM